MFIWNPKEIVVKLLKHPKRWLGEKLREKKTRKNFQWSVYEVIGRTVLEKLAEAGDEIKFKDNIRAFLEKNGYHFSPRIHIQPFFKKNQIVFSAWLAFEKKSKWLHPVEQEILEEEWEKGLFANNDRFGNCGIGDRETDDGGTTAVDENKDDNFFDDRWLKENRLTWE